MPTAPPDISQNGWDDDRGYNHNPPPEKQQSFDGWDDDFDDEDDDRSSTSTTGVPQQQQVWFYLAGYFHVQFKLIIQAPNSLKYPLFRIKFWIHWRERRGSVVECLI